MRICHVSARLPPEEGASAILPVQIARWCLDAGDESQFVAYRRPPTARRRSPESELPGRTYWVARPDEIHGAARAVGAARLACAVRAARRAAPSLAWADLVHVHGGSTVARAFALLAPWLGKPVVLTMYGPEIWEHRAARWVTGTFVRAYRAATYVVFTSHGLLSHAIERGLARRDAAVVYPPVASSFGSLDEHWRAAARTALGIRARHLLVSVKTFDEHGGQPCLIEAISEVIRTHPDTRLVLVGTGPQLPHVREAARAWGVEGHVTFVGRVDHDVVAQYDVAADAFVLPSVAGGMAVAALEALACGCPAIVADTDGGRELHELFGFDVSIVPRENPAALAGAIVHALEEKRRVRPATLELIDREHRVGTACAQYRAIYERVLARGVPAPPSIIRA